MLIDESTQATEPEVRRNVLLLQEKSQTALFERVRSNIVCETYWAFSFGEWMNSLNDFFSHPYSLRLSDAELGKESISRAAALSDVKNARREMFENVE